MERQHSFGLFLSTLPGVFVGNAVFNLVQAEWERIAHRMALSIRELSSSV